MATIFCASTPMQASKTLGLKPLKGKPYVPAARVARPVSCQAQVEDSGKKVATTVAAAALAAVVSFGAVDAAYADIAGLTPCSESAAYQKKKNKEISRLERRLSKYEEDSAPALALKATIDKTNRRFDFYAKSGLLCGNDGLPHLIADPGLAVRFGHAGDILIPTFLFLYFAGYTGYVGREYLMKTRGGKSATEKEIIIDVPLALSIMLGGAAWPLAVVQELRAGTLTEREENITVSPR